MPTSRSFLFSAAILLAAVDVRAFLPWTTAAASSRAATLQRIPKVFGPSQSLARSGHGIVRSSAGTRRRWRGSTVAMQAGEKNLFDCIREEDVDTLRRYVERGGPVHVADTLGDTSLLVAASTGNAEVVKASRAAILCGAPDAAVNYPCFHGGETPLMAACTQGHFEVTEFLVKEAGANVNATNHRGDTALSLAAFWGRLDCLKLLLSLPDTDTEILNVQGKRAGEGMQELMRDESNDEETVRLLTESRVRRGILRL
ncbi:unnamed protein product [Ectocarpus fasciculatus]